MAVLSPDFWPAVPLRLATLAAAERQAKERHPRGTERAGEGLMMKGIKRIISREHVREHVRVARLASPARTELPWVNPERVAANGRQSHTYRSSNSISYRCNNWRNSSWNE